MGSGLGFLGALTLIFVVFKLLDKLEWSWLWVFSPMWLPLAVILVFGSIVYGLSRLIDSILEYKRRMKAKK